MPKQQRLSSNHQALIGRYLIWAYKSTKESFDRLERKTTQALADDFIWKQLNSKHAKDLKDPSYKVLVENYRTYIDKKKEQPIDQSQLLYLRNRLAAVEAAIKNFLGARALPKIRHDYEQEFTRRIWESKDSHSL